MRKLASLGRSAVEEISRSLKVYRNTGAKRVRIRGDRDAVRRIMGHVDIRSIRRTLARVEREAYQIRLYIASEFAPFARKSVSRRGSYDWMFGSSGRSSRDSTDWIFGGGARSRRRGSPDWVFGNSKKFRI